MFSIDEKFKSNKGHYFFQCGLATGSLMILFSLLNFMFDTALVAALGATSFIVFTTPHKELSRARYVIGGYSIGAVVGLVFAFVFQMVGVHQGVFGILAALSVGVAIFLMVVLDFEHPPAAGVSLGLMTNGGDLYSVAVAFIGIFFVLFMRKLLRKRLIDLI
jgi:CBS-domain-containing membrane protein